MILLSFGIESVLELQSALQFSEQAARFNKRILSPDSTKKVDNWIKILLTLLIIRNFESCSDYSIS